MSKLIILTRGAPGAGKTTFLENMGLTSYVVSPDEIRAKQGGVFLDTQGHEQRGPIDEREVWLEVETTIRKLMEQKSLIVVDATFQSTRDFKMPLKLANLFKYTVVCIDFSDVSLVELHHRNSKRTGWRLVPPEVIDTAYERIRVNKIPESVTVMKPDQYARSKFAARFR